jgi:hypothetical protein
MIDRKVKKLIHKLEKILKKDPRYEENGDDIFKKQIKKIYTQNKKDIQSQVIPFMPQYNMMTDGLNVNLMPKQSTNIMSRGANIMSHKSADAMSRGANIMSHKSADIISSQNAKTISDQCTDGSGLKNLSHLNITGDMVDINTIREVNRLLQDANDTINRMI